MDFSNILRAYHITYLSELPSKDLKVDTCVMVAVPSKKKRGQFKIFTWFENEWVYTASIDKSDIELEELKNAYDDLSNAVKKPTRIAADCESDELSSKLSKITTKILQAKYELADDVIEPFENSLKEETKNEDIEDH